MNQKVHNKIVSFIWSIADDVLRDVFVRGKYRDIILPFTVLRRLDALLIPTKEKVLEAAELMEKQKIDDKSALASRLKPRVLQGKSLMILTGKHSASGLILLNPIFFVYLGPIQI